MVSYKIVLDQRRPKANGEYPIIIRIFHKRQSTSIHSGVTITNEAWSEEMGHILPTHINSKFLNKTIFQKLLKVQSIASQLEEDGDFSFENLKNKLKPNSKPKTVITFEEFANQLIEQMISIRKVGNATVYQTAVNRIIKYSNSGLTFKQIDYLFLEGFKTQLIKEGAKVNTISNYFRTIRAIYNKAIKAKIVDRSLYPFYDVTVKTERTAKRAIGIKEIKAIVRLELQKNTPLWFAQCYFLLSFCLIGTSFSDLAYLTQSSIIKGRLVFKRQKTGKLYSIKITKEAERILALVRNPDGRFLLPILPDSITENTLDARKLIQQWIKTTNKYLARISTDLPLDNVLTTYVARHTWATTAKRLGYSNELIAEAMGHEYGNATTAIYLDTFDQEVIDDMNSKICLTIFKT